MKTPWGEALDPSRVLPEYPRPQLRRDSYLNLNGPWEYAVTPEDVKRVAREYLQKERRSVLITTRKGASPEGRRPRAGKPQEVK